jgi:hypothetical protein
LAAVGALPDIRANSMQRLDFTCRHSCCSTGNNWRSPMYDGLKSFSSFATLVERMGVTIMIAESSNILSFSAIVLILAFLTARLASNKHGTFFEWLLGGSLVRSIAKRQHVALPEVKTCPKCSDQLPLSALVCDTCDYNFLSRRVGNGHKLLPAPSEPLA